MKATYELNGIIWETTKSRIESIQSANEQYKKLIANEEAYLEHLQNKEYLDGLKAELERNQKVLQEIFSE